MRHVWLILLAFVLFSCEDTAQVQSKSKSDSEKFSVPDGEDAQGDDGDSLGQWIPIHTEPPVVIDDSNDVDSGSNDSADEEPIADNDGPVGDGDDSSSDEPALDLEISELIGAVGFNEVSDPPETEWSPVTTGESEFQNESGETIRTKLWTPNLGSELRPGVLVIPGISGDRIDPQASAAAAALASQGMITMTMDPPNSTGDFFADLMDRFLGGNIQQRQIGNYSGALEYLKQQTGVDPERIYFVGISWGADTGIAFSAGEPQIKKFVSVMGGLDSTGDVGLSPEELVGDLAPRPVFLINADDDGFIDKQTVAIPFHQAALDSNPNAETKFLTGSHTMTDHDLTPIFLEVGDFLLQDD